MRHVYLLDENKKSSETTKMEFAMHMPYIYDSFNANVDKFLFVLGTISDESTNWCWYMNMNWRVSVVFDNYFNIRHIL